MLITLAITGLIMLARSHRISAKEAHEMERRKTKAQGESRKGERVWASGQHLCSGSFCGQAGLSRIDAL